MTSHKLKRNSRRTWLAIIISCLSVTLISCKKVNEFLDTKYNKSDVIPKELEDLQKLLNNDNILNSGYTALGSMSSDNYFYVPADWKANSVTERNTYVWNKDIFEGSTPADWANAYAMISYCNEVLEKLSKVDRNVSNAKLHDNIKGAAFFFKALGYYNLVQLYALPYSVNSENLGIPIKNTPDVNEKLKRNTIQEVYTEIDNLATEATLLLSEFSEKNTRPNRRAAFALQAKISLAKANTPKPYQQQNRRYP
ncbi:RagB/SusD family nutrient uptake outer membrane protein [Chitinophaga sedimenti]|uniref:RagB/SusD family nutrient uptake outer membrane protein n=1 Tax=Chitinophaga sedimenti TaxID=2033606 RepID=UPI002006B0B0|nr:RagB/SusD family nutrient uptake outer membrane protein [Chitinophaga sedimenti]MCK7559454.1 RagB/SusD family nutrient uptake outer membrane protein [Chitinophaga sedimenti]